MKLHSAFSRSRVVLSSTLIMALYATPVTYDFEHGQWQAHVAYADDDECDDEDDCGFDVAISLGNEAVIILGGDGYGYDYDHGYTDDDDDDRGYGYDDNDDDD